MLVPQYFSFFFSFSVLIVFSSVWYIASVRSSSALFAICLLLVRLCVQCYLRPTLFWQLTVDWLICGVIVAATVNNSEGLYKLDTEKLQTAAWAWVFSQISGFQKVTLFFLGIKIDFSKQMHQPVVIGHQVHLLQQQQQLAFLRQTARHCSMLVSWYLLLCLLKWSCSICASNRPTDIPKYETGRGTVSILPWGVKLSLCIPTL